LLGYAPSAPYDLLATRAVLDLGLATGGDFVALPARLSAVNEETVAVS
jgi:hypothetical protein